MKPAIEARESRAAASPFRRRMDLGISLFLAIAVFAAYGQVRHFEFINLDDPGVFRNPHLIHGLTGAGLEWAFRSTAAANWYPLTWISHMLDLQLFGQRSGYHHLTSVFIHAISSVLLFLVLKRMTGARWPSAFIAFVFALHPLHVESVAWIAERKDVLSALFWMLTMWAYLRYVERPGAVRYLLTILIFALGLMSKAMVVTLPFALLLLDAWPLDRIRMGKRRAILEKAPMIALSFCVSAVTYYAQRNGGAVATLQHIPLMERVENALISYAAYLIQFVWPSNLAVFYPYGTASAAGAVVAGILLAAITIFVVRARREPYLAAGWLWYLGTLVPVIGLVQVGGQSRADRYTYIPLIGVSMMVAFGVADLIKKYKISRTFAGICAAIVCIIWFAATWNQVGYWHDSVALFEHTIRATPENDFAYDNLGVAFRQHDRLPEAAAAFERAIAIQPNSGEAQDDLGEALLTEGRAAEAMPHLVVAVKLQPDSAQARENLATALNMSGRITEAEAQYRIALDYNPENAAAHGGLGVVLDEEGDAAAALEELETSIRLGPEDAAAHYNLGRVESQLGRNEEAVRQFAESVRLRPSSVDAHLSLGSGLLAENRAPEALAEFQQAEGLNPNSAGAHFNAGMALAGLRRYEEAIGEFGEALRIDPNLAAAKENIEYYSKVRSKQAASR